VSKRRTPQETSTFGSIMTFSSQWDRFPQAAATSRASFL
jgi:hypothetical protein